MNREDFEPYLNRHVKIVQRDGYAVYGIITHINDTTVTIESKHKGTIGRIAMDFISLIVNKEEVED